MRRQMCDLAVPAATDHDAIEFYGDSRHTVEDCVNYARMRRMGESHRMAEILALRTFPATRTDKEFLKGTHEQFADAPGVGDRYKAIAEAHGLNTNGLVYIRGLARFPGDPQAWVSGRGDVSRIAEERGWGVHGAVEVERREVEPEPDITVADDIVADLATDLVEEGMDPREATQLARDIRSGKVDDYDPAEHVQDIPSEGLEWSPDFQ
jgi:hypothetical protein